MSANSLQDSGSTYVEALLDRIRGGQPVELGHLLERYSHYLALLTSLRLPDALKGKVDASDVVQETFVRAHAGFGQFRGTTELEFRCWIREVLASELATQCRRYLGTQKRDIRLEVDMRAGVDHSSMQLDEALIASDTSPSQGARRKEDGVRLANALSALIHQEREVILLHHFRDIPLNEIATRLGLSDRTIYRIWARSLRHLKQLLEEES